MIMDKGTYLMNLCSGDVRCMDIKREEVQVE
jgi:hypothetical protein